MRGAHRVVVHCLLHCLLAKTHHVLEVVRLGSVGLWLASIVEDRPLQIGAKVNVHRLDLVDGSSQVCSRRVEVNHVSGCEVHVLHVCALLVRVVLG